MKLINSLFYGLFPTEAVKTLDRISMHDMMIVVFIINLGICKNHFLEERNELSHWRSRFGL